MSSSPLVTLGFSSTLEKDDSFKDELMPNKIGGKPVWMLPFTDNIHKEISEDLKCEWCNERMPLLLQIYAPLSMFPSAYHRMIFVFCCKNGSCHDSLPNGSCLFLKQPPISHSFVVLRCQLPKENDFYIENEEGELHGPKLQVCEVCGMGSSMRCGGCKHMRYCSKKHQKIDWSMGHKEECKLIKKGKDPKEYGIVKRNSGILFKELILETDPEEPPDDEELEALQKKIKDQIKSLRRGVMRPAEEKDEYNPPNRVSQTFVKFKASVERYPDQCLRYGRDLSPIWISEENQPKIDDIPVCEYCGAERCFEFQIQPQLLFDLDVEHVNKADTMDVVKTVSWGVLAIYTCSSSCNNDNTKYLKEFLWRQPEEETRVDI